MFFWIFTLLSEKNNIFFSSDFIFLYIYEYSISFFIFWCDCCCSAFFVSFNKFLYRPVLLLDEREREKKKERKTNRQKYTIYTVILCGPTESNKYKFRKYDYHTRLLYSNDSFFVSSRSPFAVIVVVFRFFVLFSLLLWLSLLVLLLFSSTSSSFFSSFLNAAVILFLSATKHSTLNIPFSKSVFWFCILMPATHLLRNRRKKHRSNNGQVLFYYCKLFRLSSCIFHTSTFLIAIKIIKQKKISCSFIVRMKNFNFIITASVWGSLYRTFYIFEELYTCQLGNWSYTLIHSLGFFLAIHGK